MAFTLAAPTYFKNQGHDLAQAPRAVYERQRLNIIIRPPPFAGLENNERNTFFLGD